tara:strand:- start:267 stop:590 length:324 start_codon:yes stop_codon:yes gene_type:complete
MKEIIIKNRQSKNKLIVDVKLPARRYISDQVVEFSNSELQAYLKKEGYVLEDYELESKTNESLTSYTNKANPPILEGTWVFMKKETKKVNKKNPGTYKKKLDNNTGD